tara:strand:+ start:79 stop:411 length:333 start_codon:yes stop_codon:yes gene_type:complete
MPSNISVSGGNSFADYFDDGAVANTPSSTTATGVIVNLSGKGIAYLTSNAQPFADIEIDGKALSSVSVSVLGSYYSQLTVNNTNQGKFAFSKSLKITKLDSNALTWGVLI